jgi:hypothetical protein
MEEKMNKLLANEVGLQSPISKRLPPYAKKICDGLKNGMKPKNDIFIFLGKYSWKKAASFLNIHSVASLPDGDNPANYLWWFVKGFSVLVIDTSGVGSEVIRRLAYELLKAGATVVRVVLVSYKLVIFRQGGGL